MSTCLKSEQPRTLNNIRKNRTISKMKWAQRDKIIKHRLANRQWNTHDKVQATPLKSMSNEIRKYVCAHCATKNPEKKFEQRISMGRE